MKANKPTLLLFSLLLASCANEKESLTPAAPETDPQRPEEEGPKDTLRITERANTFVVTPGTVVLFTPCKGNSDVDIPDVLPEVVWQDNPNLVKNVFADEDNMVMVDLRKNQAGNAVIGARNFQGEVQWTWTLWVTQEKPADVVVSTPEGGDFTFMDRNIGALSATALDDSSTGNVYQWGRKDAFPGPTYSTTQAVQRPIYDMSGQKRSISYEDIQLSCHNNIPAAIAHPLVSYKSVGTNGFDGNYSWITSQWNAEEMNGVDTLWNNSGRKTIFDPCPAGYKVPQASVWDALFFKAVTPSPDTTVLFNSAYTVDKSITKNWSSERAAQYHWQARFRGAKFGDLYLIAGGSLDHQGNVKCVPADKAIHTRLWTATAFSPRSNSYQFGAYAACVGPSYAHQVAEFKLYDSSESTAHRFSNLYPVRCIKE